MKSICLSIVFLIVSFISIHAATNADTIIVIGGTEHPLRVTIPESYNPAVKYPLIVGLHYCTGNSNEYRNALLPLCDSLNTIIVCPDNNGAQMTNPDFILASIDTARSIYNIDTTSVYLTGMSCNGFETLVKGLNAIYPFKGIIPWVPYFSTFNNTTFNLNSKIPTVISVGSEDGNYAAIIRLYDSLKARTANINLSIVQGVGHTLSFANFDEEMIRCYYYLNDTNSINIDPIENFDMLNTDSEITIKVKVTHANGKEMQFRAISSHSSIIANPLIETTVGSDTVKLKISPIVNKSGLVHIIFEASEKESNAIEQQVFKVNIINAPASSIQDTDYENLIRFYPNPAQDYLNISAINENTVIEISDLVGRILLHKTISQKSEPIDISSYPKGLYLINSIHESNKTTTKFIIE